VICNGLKWTIFTTDELELLLMVLELGTSGVSRRMLGPIGVDDETPY